MAPLHQSSKFQDHPAARTPKRLYRVALQTSGTVTVLAVLILAGTSLVLPLHDDVQHLSLLPDPLRLARLPTLLSQLLLMSPSDSQEESSSERDALDIHTPDVSSEDDIDSQFHRRLKRRVDRPDAERERKREEARARAMKIQPSAVRKDYVSIRAPPPNDEDGDRLVFASDEAESRYYQATHQFQDVAQRLRLDPLGVQAAPNTSRVPFEPQVQYLGVLVDAGRHYFPLSWWKRLIVYLHRLRFNLIHFRLTDDQAFNIKLESYPELAFASVALSIEAETHHQGESNIHISENKKVYTPKELRELVAFAKEHGIAMVPEINLPGHAGSWAGIPDLVLNCPEFVCGRGYGIPLNVEHPQLKTILKGVIGEVLEVFDNPPLLHLGGDETHMSDSCFKELGKSPFNYTQFELLLQEVLDDLEYPTDQVLRWEETGLPTKEELKRPKPPRTGAIEHFWHYLPKNKPNRQTKWRKKPFFVSHDLYMDVNHDSGADIIYNATLTNYQLGMGPSYYPIGIVAGAFELGTDFWLQRNVAARLIAVAMGAARLNFTSMNQFWNTYNSTCRETIGLDASVCDLQGHVAVATLQYQRDWSETWINWTKAICDRMTEPKKELIMPRVEAHNRTTFEEANKHFWRTLKQPLVPRRRILHHDLTKAKAGADSSGMDTTTGVLLDLVNAMRPASQVTDLLKKYIAPLDISLAQLRLADNNAFAIDLDWVSRLGYSASANPSNPLPRAEDFEYIVQAAGELGIEVLPEITLSTNAGGWINSGFSLHCPQVFCNATVPHQYMANNIGKREFLPVVYSVIRELMDIFSTSRYIHLGSDERKSNLACFEEDGRYKEPPFEAYERGLTKLLQEYLGMSTQHILRWENEEQVHYPGRTGDITHYRSTNPFVPPPVRKGEPFFVTLDLLAPMPSDTSQSVFYEIYKNTRKLMAMQPQAILAELRNLDEATWFRYYVGLRLLSFQLGSHHELDEYSLEEFEAHLVKECHRVQFDHCEKIMEGSVVMPAEDLTHFVDTLRYRERVCVRHAEMSTSRKAKATIH